MAVRELRCPSAVLVAEDGLVAGEHHIRQVAVVRRQCSGSVESQNNEGRLVVAVVAVEAVVRGDKVAHTGLRGSYLADCYVSCSCRDAHTVLRLAVERKAQLASRQEPPPQVLHFE
jgi:hypothetical protein